MTMIYTFSLASFIFFCLICLVISLIRFKASTSLHRSQSTKKTKIAKVREPVGLQYICNKQCTGILHAIKRSSTLLNSRFLSYANAQGLLQPLRSLRSRCMFN